MVRPTIDQIDSAIASPEAWFRLRETIDSDTLSDFSFDGQMLMGLDFTNLDLERCTFRSCRILHCNFSRTNLYGASFEEAEIKEANFSGSILSQCAFTESEIEKCDFSAAEAAGIVLVEASFESCELSRCRGLSQFSIDQAVGNSSTSIPQFLDYPEHWLTTDEEREETDWTRKLSAFRGDDLLFCSFDGQKLSTIDARNSERKEVEQTLQHLQTKVRNAVDGKLLHNDCPAIFSALEDYYHVISSPAGEKNQRWLLKLGELEEIKVGLEGNCLISQVEAMRGEIEKAFPHKVAQLDHIMSTHALLATGLTRWRSFVQGANEARITDSDVDRIVNTGLPISDFLDSLPENVDPIIPDTIRVLRRLKEKPKEIAKLGAYGIVRCIESVFASIFVFVRRIIVNTANEITEILPKTSVKLLVSGLAASGVYAIFAIFPHLNTWLTGGMAVLKGLGLTP
jgi:uncharacterized protein YjbI with pentapeptide repeats